MVWVGVGVGVGVGLGVGGQAKGPARDKTRQKAAGRQAGRQQVGDGRRRLGLASSHPVIQSTIVRSKSDKTRQDKTKLQTIYALHSALHCTLQTLCAEPARQQE